MTVEDLAVRRSQRTSSSNPRSSQYVSDLSDIDDIISDEDDSTSDNDDDDEDYGKTSQKRKPHTKNNSSNKKRRLSKKDKVALTIDDLDDFVENYIFQALSSSDISISELAINWIEDYETNNKLALKDLINFVLRCCGCVLQIQEHDVENNESAVETIGEIQQVFTNQQFHEYPLTTTNSKWKNFKTNVLNFISEVLSTANEKDILCNEQGDLMENLLIWLSALSTSQLRPLRYCSTIFLLQMETALCEITVKTSTTLEKQQRQYDVESKKLKESKEKLEKTKMARERSKIEKDIQKVAKRLESISISLSSSKDQKSTLEDYLKDISNTTFVHRYRDVDPKIRQECMISLGQWIDILPEQFFETSYLRYFGWILSDRSPNVRLEVIKSLLRLYKKAVIVPGFRQFTERFKGRVIEMAIYDSDYGVRLAALSLIFEILKIGFLEEDDILKVTSLIFCNRSNKINLICSTENKYLRIQHEISRIINVVEMEQTKEANERFLAAIVNSEKQFNIDLHEMIKQKTLFQIIESSYLHFKENYLKLESKQQVDENQKFINAFKMLFILPGYESSTLFEFLYQYLTFDLSAVELVDPTIKAKVELTATEKELLLSFMAGILTLLIQDEESYNNSILKLHHIPQKRKDTDSGLEIADKDLVANKLISYLPQLLVIFKNINSLQTILRLYVALLGYSRKQLDSLKLESLNPISETILAIFRDLEVDNLNLSKFESFKDFFSAISGDSKDITQQKTKLLVDSLVAELSSELLSDLNQATDLDSIKPLALTLSKLLIVGNAVDLSENLELEDKETGTSIISLICDKCFKNEDSKRDEIDSLLLMLKLFSCYISWKFENLITDSQNVLLNDNFVISEYLKSITPIFEVVRDISLEDDLKEVLKDESLIYVIDLLVLMKSFQVNMAEKLKNLENDDKLIDLNTFFEITIGLKVDRDLAKALLNTFLVKENKWAKLSDIQLDRDENEDVNFDTGDEEDGFSLEKRIEIEDSLCIFTIKLLTLHKIGLLPVNIYKRLLLNKERLDSEPFKKLFGIVVKEEAPLQVKEADPVNHAALDTNIFGEDDIEMSL